MPVPLPAELHERIALLAISDTPNYALYANDGHPEFLFHVPPPNPIALRCSLVCWKWLRISRAHAFQAIELTSDVSSKTFLTLASRPLATFVPFVENLVLNGETPERFQSSQEELTQLIPSLPMFPNLRHLTLVNLLLHEIEKETWWREAVPRLFRPSLTTLRISWCMFTSPMTFTKSIERCVSLTSLDVFDVRLPLQVSKFPNLEGTKCHLPALKSLFLKPSRWRPDCMDVLLREILQSHVTRGYPRVSSLGILLYSAPFPGLNPPMTLAPFVKEFGGTITTLYLTPMVPWRSGELLSNIYLHLHALQNIHFILETCLKFNSNISIAAILQGIDSSAPLSTLHYNMGDVALFEARDRIEWDTVVNMMNGPHIPHLETVVVTFGGNEEAVREWEGWVEKQIRARLTRPGVFVRTQQILPRILESIFRDKQGMEA
ncbi:hypothetical protein DL96DRAFT_1812292 [Flagelloscypha sp. PMI_526]|nr:hypothetical protein DL96DRAFT_1812292 [Flagelloscypha sp. PMI_526]